MNCQVKTITILVAEDDYLVGDEVCRKLKALGYTDIITAADGREAVEKTLSHKPGLILMDMNMPDMNGLEACRQIQAACPTPAIMLTAYESRELAMEAGEAGIAAYLVKPPREKELERAIIIALARHADLMELKRINSELERATEAIKKLREVLPICMYCRKIRSDEGYWQKLESYLLQYGDIVFTHGICPECRDDLYAEKEAERLRRSGTEKPAP